MRRSPDAVEDLISEHLLILATESDTRAAPSWVDARVTVHHRTVDRYWMLVLDAPTIATTAQPGQFVMLTPARAGEIWPVLPRPMAIYDCDPVRGTITILYGAVGAGTRRLTTFVPGETIVTVGPLGRAFEIDSDVQSLLLVGRGIGICSLTMLASAATERGVSVVALSSGRSPHAIVGRDRYRAAEIVTHEVYDSDGSSEQAVVGRWLEQRFATERPNLIAVCGSNRLISLASNMATGWKAEVQISLEARMACGLGYCHGCSTSRPTAGMESPLICRDGPVFRLADRS